MKLDDLRKHAKAHGLTILEIKPVAPIFYAIIEDGKKFVGRPPLTLEQVENVLDGLDQADLEKEPF